MESRPCKKVFVMEDVEAGALTLVPFSTSVVVDDATEKRIAPPTQVMPKLGTDTGKAQLELFWCVQKLPKDKDGKEPEAVNMHLVNCRVLGAVGVRMAYEDTNDARVGRFLLIC